MFTEAELRSLSRKELQAAAKKHGVKANGSSEAIISDLLELLPAKESEAEAEVPTTAAAAVDDSAAEPEQPMEVQAEEREDAGKEQAFSEEHLAGLSRKELQALAREHSVKANGSNKAIIAALLSLQTESKDSCSPAAPTTTTSVVIEMTLDDYMRESSAKQAGKAKQSKRARGTKKSAESSKVALPSAEEIKKAARLSAAAEQSTSEDSADAEVDAPEEPPAASKPKQSKRTRGARKSAEDNKIVLPSAEEIKKAARLSAAAERLTSQDSADVETAAPEEPSADTDAADADAIAFSSLRKDMKVMVRIGSTKKWAKIKRKSNTYVRVELENGDEEKLDDSHVFFRCRSTEETAAETAAEADAAVQRPRPIKKAIFAALPTPTKRPFAAIKSPLGRSTPGLGPAERKQVRAKVATPVIYRQPSIPIKKNRLAEVREELAKKRKSQAHQAMENKRASVAHETFSKITRTKIAGSNRPTKPSVTKAASSKVTSPKAAVLSKKLVPATTPGKTPNFDRIHKRQFEAQQSIVEKAEPVKRAAPSAQKRVAPTRHDAEGQAAKRKKKPANESDETASGPSAVAPGSAAAVKKRRKSTVPQPFQLGTARENFTFKPYSGAVPQASDAVRADENQPPATKNIVVQPARSGKVSRKQIAAGAPEKPAAAAVKGAPRMLKQRASKRAAAKA